MYSRQQVHDSWNVDLYIYMLMKSIEARLTVVDSKCMIARSIV